MELSLNISFYPTQDENQNSFIGAEVTFGKNRRRWQIKGLTGKQVGNNPDPVMHNYFAIACPRGAPESECSAKIVSFRVEDLENGEVKGKEIGLCLDKEGDVWAWFPLSKPPPPTIED